MALILDSPSPCPRPLPAVSALEAQVRLYRVPEASRTVGLSQRYLRDLLGDPGVPIQITHKLPGARGNRISHGALRGFADAYAQPGERTGPAASDAGHDLGELGQLRLYTIPEVAALLSLSVRFLKSLLADPDVPLEVSHALPGGRGRRISHESLMAFVRAHARRPRSSASLRASS